MVLQPDFRSECTRILKPLHLQNQVIEGLHSGSSSTRVQNLSQHLQAAIGVHVRSPTNFQLCLCQIFEHVGVILVPFEIVTRYQIFNPLLDCFNIRLHDVNSCISAIIAFKQIRMLKYYSHIPQLLGYLEHSTQLLNTFHDQILVAQEFPTLHDAHN